MAGEGRTTVDIAGSALGYLPFGSCNVTGAVLYGACRPRLARPADRVLEPSVKSEFIASRSFSPSSRTHQTSPGRIRETAKHEPLHKQGLATGQRYDRELFHTGLQVSRVR